MIIVGKCFLLLSFLPPPFPNFLPPPLSFFACSLLYSLSSYFHSLFFPFFCALRHLPNKNLWSKRLIFLHLTDGNISTYRKPQLLLYMSPGLLCTFIVKIFISSTIISSALFILKVDYDIILLQYDPKALLMWDCGLERNKIGT